MYTYLYEKKTKLIQPFFFQFTSGTKIIFLLKKRRRNVHFWNICVHIQLQILCLDFTEFKLQILCLDFK